MARAIVKRNSFNAGEISALALGRTDLPQYQNACEELQNFIPLITGGITRRPGTRFICNAMGPSRLVPFVFSLTQAFILEFGDRALRFYTNGAQVQTVTMGPPWAQNAGGTAADGALTWTNEGFPAWRFGGHPLGQVILDPNGNIQVVTTGGYNILGNVRPTFSTVIGGTTGDGIGTIWTCMGQPAWQPLTIYAPNAVVYTAFGIQQVTAGGGGESGPATTSTPYQIATPFDIATDDLWDLKFAQQGDIVYIVHPNHPPMKLARVSDSNWTLTQPTFRPPPLHSFDQDIGSPNADHPGVSITLTPAAGSGMGVMFSASAACFIAADVGKQIIAGSGIAFITAMTGASKPDPNTGAALFTQVTADIVDAFASTAAIAAGSWFLRGSPQSYACFGNGDAGTFNYTQKFGLGQILTLLTFNVFPAGGGAANAKSDSWREIDVGRYVSVGGGLGQIVSLDPNHGSYKANVRMLAPISITQTNPTTGAITASPISGGAWTVYDPAFGPVNGYPRAVCFSQDRLVLAGSLALPQTIWWSVPDDYENFAVGALAGSAIIETVNSGGLESILAVEDFNGNLAVMTARSEYMIGGGAIQWGSVAQALTPSNVTPIRQSRWGATRIQPLEVQGNLLYVKRSGLIAGEMIFDIQTSKYRTKNLNILSELITVSGFKEMVYQQFPNYVIWFTTLDGQLVGLTYESEQQVSGWHRHFTGQDLWSASAAATAAAGQGQVTVVDTPPLRPDQFVSIASIPDPTTVTDQLWACCMRNVLSPGPPPTDTQTYTIELFDPTLYVDYGSQAIFNPAGAEVGDLQYLAGRTAVANADGAALRAKPIDTTGTYELWPYKSGKGLLGSNIQVGLNFISKAVTTRVELPGPGADTAQGLLKRYVRIFERVYQSVGAIVDGWRIPFRTPSDPMTAGVPPFTGDVALENNVGADRDGRVTIVQDQPLPMTVLAQFGTLQEGAN
jgi:hypothetical protein